MSGYTPLYSTMLEGTLFGRWPHTGVWACLLSVCDRDGTIDKTPQLLAAAIGIPVDELMACIKDFCEPDPQSRTPDHDGRRLELIDPHRAWGWRVLNHAKYREKARKHANDAKRVETGENLERMRQRRPVVTRDNPPSSPAPTPTPTPSPGRAAEKPQTDSAARIRALATAKTIPRSQ